MGAAATPEPQDHTKSRKLSGQPLSLPKHSYWYDFWVFVVFDVLLFLVVYFIVP